MELKNSLFWIGHAGFYIKCEGYNIFIDPFNIKKPITDKADLILITHAHYDHCSVKDIKQVMKPDAEIFCPNGCLEDADFKNLRRVKPGFEGTFKDTKISAIPAYNIKDDRLNFHPKANGWVGYVVDANKMRIYHAGDTDFIDEMKRLSGIDASLLPIGGTYTMDVNEAIDAATAIKPKFAIPMHYKSLLGEAGSRDAESLFKQKLNNALIMKEI